MADHPILISNNPNYLENTPAKAELRYVDGGVLAVLIAARDLAHQGWILANHPLYGNYRPHQQPYRSLIMLPPQSKNSFAQDYQEPCSPLELLEQALSLYQSPAPKCMPADVPEHMRKDCAKIDVELLRATLDSLS